LSASLSTSLVSGMPAIQNPHHNHKTVSVGQGGGRSFNNPAVSQLRQVKSAVCTPRQNTAVAAALALSAGCLQKQKIASQDSLCTEHHISFCCMMQQLASPTVCQLNGVLASDCPV
jgi:hypothetical protein